MKSNIKTKVTKVMKENISGKMIYIFRSILLLLCQPLFLQGKFNQSQVTVLQSDPWLTWIFECLNKKLCKKHACKITTEHTNMLLEELVKCTNKQFFSKATLPGYLEGKALIQKNFFNFLCVATNTKRFQSTQARNTNSRNRISIKNANFRDRLKT